MYLIAACPLHSPLVPPRCITILFTTPAAAINTVAIAAISSPVCLLSPRNVLALMISLPSRPYALVKVFLSYQPKEACLLHIYTYAEFFHHGMSFSITNSLR